MRRQIMPARIGQDADEGMIAHRLQGFAKAGHARL